MKSKYIDVVCPTCEGSGSVKRRHTNYSDEVRAKARKLYRKGLSLREIGKEIGVNHPQKVWALINAKTL